VVFHNIFRHMAEKYIEIYDTLQYSAPQCATRGRILKYGTSGILVHLIVPQIPTSKSVHYSPFKNVLAEKLPALHGGF
jgi:hypothetical protein